MLRFRSNWKIWTDKWRLSLKVFSTLVCSSVRLLLAQEELLPTSSYWRFEFNLRFPVKWVFYGIYVKLYGCSNMLSLCFCWTSKHLINALTVSESSSTEPDRSRDPPSEAGWPPAVRCWTTFYKYVLKTLGHLSEITPDHPWSHRVVQRKRAGPIT